ncbi:hypothetical protein [Antarcticirhabdus aurantiaca]|uniref:Uncharacterized protein n=1 Tax=Antarcticirhabdus aurantiaca TaxID=2606717 RepID=A0ACD4NNU2_9HYPH|nr:hypothetical protein [Antarcticirhabdus aurantiaca]WAJ28417.1 hypothetical protein OXU80_27005 [Jeongeuplla avenae]
MLAADTVEHGALMAVPFPAMQSAGIGNSGPRSRSRFIDFTSLFEPVATTTGGRHAGKP